MKRYTETKINKIYDSIGPAIDRVVSLVIDEFDQDTYRLNAYSHIESELVRMLSMGILASSSSFIETLTWISLVSKGSDYCETRRKQVLSLENVFKTL